MNLTKRKIDIPGKKPSVDELRAGVKQALGAVASGDNTQRSYLKWGTHTVVEVTAEGIVQVAIASLPRLHRSQYRVVLADYRFRETASGKFILEEL